MSEWVKLTASDGHELDAYVARPAAEPSAAIVVVQEIFGVNGSIRGVADSYAAHGYLAIAPALFDRFERGLELGYDSEDQKKAMSLYGQLNPDTQLLDVAAAFAWVSEQAQKPVGIVGFCYGGLLSWLSATRGAKVGMAPAACVGYYAGGIGKVAGEQPACPVMLHFGEQDSHIGPDQIDAVTAAHPEVPVFLYPEAGHAFANEARSSYVPEAKSLAFSRSLAFLQQHLS